MKQSLKKYCLEADNLPSLTEKMNDFMKDQNVGEIVDLNYFQEQYGDSVKTTEKGENNNGYINNSKTTISTYYWKYMVIITILKEEDVERRLS